MDRPGKIRVKVVKLYLGSLLSLLVPQQGHLIRAKPRIGRPCNTLYPYTSENAHPTVDQIIWGRKTLIGRLQGKISTGPRLAPMHHVLLHADLRTYVIRRQRLPGRGPSLWGTVAPEIASKPQFRTRADTSCPCQITRYTQHLLTIDVWMDMTTIRRSSIKDSSAVCVQ